MKAIILIMGPAGCGKYTVAKEIVALDGSLKLVHNHHVNNVIFDLVNPDGKTKLPEYVWENVSKVRSAVLDTIRATDRNEGYVFTNILVDGEDSDLSLYSEIRDIAKAKKLRFCPVRLTISVEELCARIGSPGRAEMMKDVSPENAKEFMEKAKVLVPKSDRYLELDVTDLRPEESARMIVEWSSG